MEGLIPFVYGAIKKRRRRADHYELLSTGAAARGRDQRFTGGGDACRYQSCRFAAHSPADEPAFSGEDGRPPPEGLSDEPFSPAGRSERGLYSKSTRFSSSRVLACVSGA